MIGMAHHLLRTDSDHADMNRTLMSTTRVMDTMRAFTVRDGIREMISIMISMRHLIRLLLNLRISKVKMNGSKTSKLCAVLTLSSPTTSSDLQLLSLKNT